MTDWLTTNDVAEDTLAMHADGMQIAQGTDRSGGTAVVVSQAEAFVANADYEIIAEFTALSVTGAGGPRIFAGGIDVWGQIIALGRYRKRVTMGGSPEALLKCVGEGIFDGVLSELYAYPIVAANDDRWETAQMQPGATRSFTFGAVEEGEDYELRLRTRAPDGRPSVWSTVQTHTVVGKTSPPPDVTGLSIEALTSGIRLIKWDPLTVPDRRGVEIRAKSGTSSDANGDWASATPLHFGFLTEGVLETGQMAKGTWTIFARGFDTSGNESTNVTAFQVDLPDPPLGSVLLQINERLQTPTAWPGTITGGYISAGLEILQARTSTINDLPATIAELPSTINAIGTSAGTLVYETGWFDVGEDTDFEPVVQVDHNNSVTKEMMVRTEAEGETSGSWEALGPATQKRHGKIRITITGSLCYIRNVITTISATELTDLRQAVDTSVATPSPIVDYEHIGTGDIKLEARTSISSIRMVRVTVLTAGLKATVASKSTTLTGHSLPACQIKLTNDSGVATDGSIDVEIIGIRKES